MGGGAQGGAFCGSCFVTLPRALLDLPRCLPRFQQAYPSWVGSLTLVLRASCMQVLTSPL
eukprot:349801-Chlamydomonas_euryale.AAC.66